MISVKANISLSILTVTEVSGEIFSQVWEMFNTEGIGGKLVCPPGEDGGSEGGEYTVKDVVLKVVLVRFSSLLVMLIVTFARKSPVSVGVQLKVKSLVCCLETLPSKTLLVYTVEPPLLMLRFPLTLRSEVPLLRNLRVK